MFQKKQNNQTVINKQCEGSENHNQGCQFMHDETADEENGEMIELGRCERSKCFAISKTIKKFTNIECEVQEELIKCFVIETEEKGSKRKSWTK